MANIYDVAAAIKQPDIVGNFNQGVQTAQQNQVFGEKQQAYQQAQADQQNIRALAPQIIAGDPAAADQAAAIDPDAAAKYQGVADQHLKRLSGAISYIDSQKDPQAKEAAYQQVRPFLAQFGQQPPATFAEAEPKMEAARAQIAALSPGKLMNIAAGGAAINDVTGKVVYQNPGAGPKPQLIQTADGGYAWATPGAGATPVTYGGAQGSAPAASQPPSDPMTPFIAQANEALKMGAPEEQVKTWLMQKASAMSGQPIAPSDQSPQAQNQALQAPAAGVQGVQAGAPVMAPPKQPAQDALEKRIALARQMGATDDEVRSMVVGAHGDAPALPPLIDPQLSGNEALQAVPQGKRSQVQAIIDGRYPVPTGRQANSPEWQQLIQTAQQIDPTLDAGTYKARAVARQKFTSGKEAGEIKSLNTLAGHLKTLESSLDALGNSDYSLVNRAKNFSANELGNTDRQKAIGNYETAAKAVGDEAAKVFAGGQSALADREGIARELASDKPNEALRARVKTYAELVESRLHAFQDQAQQALGYGSHNIQIITPEAQKVFDEISQGQSVGGASAGTAAQGAAKPQYRAVNSMGHAVVWNGSAWVPE